MNGISTSGFVQAMILLAAFILSTFLTGTLLMIGDGTLSPESIPRILSSLDRQQAGPTAPAQGLTLWEVVY